MRRRYERIFPSGCGDLRRVPFPQAFRTRTTPLYDPASVRGLLRRSPILSEVDPGRLWATQPAITRPGVNYYLGEEYTRTGRTYADFHRPTNRYPLIQCRTHPVTGEEQFIILAGHHRSTAALIEGRPVLARVIENPTIQDLPEDPDANGAATRRAIAITPSLWLIPRGQYARGQCGRGHGARDHCAGLSRGVTGTSTVADARRVLAGQGLDDDEVDERIRFARIGQS